MECRLSSRSICTAGTQALLISRFEVQKNGRVDLKAAGLSEIVSTSSSVDASVAYVPA